MKSHLMELPPELREHLFGFLPSPDLLKVACCSKALCACVVPLLWRCVSVPCHVLEKLSLPRIVRNLKHTNSLCIFKHTSLTSHQEVDTYPLLQRHKRKNQTWMVVSFNYTKLLNNCNPNKLTRLQIVGIPTNPNIKQTVHVLKNLRELSLNGTSFLFHTDWQHLTQLHHLHKLSLTECGVDDNDINDISQCAQLRHIHLEGCCFIRDESLKHISRLKQLTHFTLTNNVFISPTAFQYLDSLPQLTHLHIESTCLNNESLIHLSEHLTNLQVLKLGDNNVSDPGFSQIHTLTKLVDLNVDLCWHITDDCFTLISEISNLERVSFTAIHLTEDVFIYLRKLPKLQHVVVINVDFHAWHSVITTFCEEMGMQRLWTGFGEVSYEKFQTVVLQKLTPAKTS